MIMVGDTLIHSRVYRDAYKNGKYDFNYIFDEVRDFFRNYDLFFYNQALHAGAHLVDIVLEALERVGDTLVHQVALADDAHLAAHNLAAGDGAAGDIAALAELENLAHLRLAGDDVLHQRVEQAGHGLLHLVDQLVDDGVKLELDALALGHLADAGVYLGVKAQDDRIRGAGQGGVGLGNGSDSGVNDLGLHLVRFNFVDGIDDGLDRALCVGLDDELEGLGLVRLCLAEQSLESHLALT